MGRLAELPIPAAIIAAGLVAPVSVALPSSNATYAQSELTQRLNLIEIGQALPAQIQSQLTDGSYLVQVANTVVQMQLPQGVPVGTQYTATLIARDPRPTFLLQNDASTPQSSETSLSNTAHLITSLLQTTASKTAATPLSSTAPIVAQPNVSASALASALKTALTQTGLFYESHLSQWVQGQRSLTSIQQEPQATQTQQLMADSGFATGNAGNMQSPLTANAASNHGAESGTLTNNPSLSAAQPANNPQNSTQTTPSNPMLTQLVQHQLQTLENNQVLWQGQVWPGQSMQWSIADDTPSSQQGTAQESAAWNSRMTLNMPELGQMNIQINLSGKQVHITIQADSSQTCQALSSQQNVLLNQLNTAGLKLEHLQIQPSSDTMLPSTS